ncbi:MAG: hypothetical protein GY711_27530 [bacterium]|nr:hypothetical protein [bacterium]
MTTNDTRITPAPDGPYIVDGIDELHGETGPLEAKDKMALCRCGASNNKPFCDGQHAKIGFSGANTADPSSDKLDDYEGDTVTIHDNRGACAHAGFCTDRLPAVFRMKQEPWIDPSAASAADVVRVVKSCPSGALRTSFGGEQHPEPTGAAKIFVAKNGPYVVTGDCTLEGAQPGAGVSAQRRTLCRCGGSKNKPFCDGAHWNVQFDPPS